MLDFEIPRCTRCCAKTGRELAPGETYYSALVAAGAETRRLDFAIDAWDQPPEGTIAWWKAELPGADNKRPHWAPNDVLLGYFQQLEQDETNEDVRYVLALLLIRRRIVQLEETVVDESGRETIVLFCPRQDLEFRVRVELPSNERAKEIQDELTRLLMSTN